MHDSNYNTMTIRPHAVNLTEAARYLGMRDSRTILKLIREGRLRAVKISDRNYRVPVQALRDFLGEK